MYPEAPNIFMDNTIKLILLCPYRFYESEKRFVLYFMLKNNGKTSDHTQKYCNNDNMFYYQKTAQQISSTHTHIRDYSNMFKLFLTAIFREH